jgi:rsbT co-antagonist protein RsbR
MYTAIAGKRKQLQGAPVVTSKDKFAEVLSKRNGEIMASWLELQAESGRRLSAAERQETTRQSREFMAALTAAAKKGSDDGTASPEWSRLKEILSSISASRAKGGHTPSETAAFVFSLKKPLFSAVLDELGTDPAALGETLWQVTELLDSLGLHTTEAFQRTRENIIARQQQELLELSTPVVRLWENVLALPLIGTLDSARTQVVMQNLLDAIVETRSDFAIIDITGVPVVDTLVAQHLLKTVAAARLMGADCLISGIRPQIAQTIIHLGVDLANVTTKATLADAFSVALRRSGLMVVKAEKKTAGEPRQTE